MASGDTLTVFTADKFSLTAGWAFVAFTSGGTEPSPGDTIWGDTSDENGILEFISLESGAWSGTAAGYMLLSNLTGVVGDWTSGENFTANTTTPGNHGTLTALPVRADASLDTRNGDVVRDFDAASNEVFGASGFMPRHYSNGGVTCTVGVMSTTATGDMSWKIFFKSFTNNAPGDDMDVKQFAAPRSNATINSPTTVGAIRYFTIAFTDGAQMDSVVAGEWFHILLMRDAQDTTNDDMTGDAQVLFIEMKEA